MLDRVDSGLTLQQYRLLTLLDAGDERSTALAQRLAVSKPAISTSVEALSSVGYVARRADDDDRRASWLQITGAGQRALRRADEAYAQRLHTVAARMEDPESFCGRSAILRLRSRRISRNPRGPIATTTGPHRVGPGRT